MLSAPTWQRARQSSSGWTRMGLSLALCIVQHRLQHLVVHLDQVAWPCPAGLRSSPRPRWPPDRPQSGPAGPGSDGRRGWARDRSARPVVNRLLGHILLGIDRHSIPGIFIGCGAVDLLDPWRGRRGLRSSLTARAVPAGTQIVRVYTGLPVTSTMGILFAGAAHGCTNFASLMPGWPPFARSRYRLRWPAADPGIRCTGRGCLPDSAWISSSVGFVKFPGHCQYRSESGRGCRNRTALRPRPPGQAPKAAASS